jgi:hypothetical protein
MVPPVMFMLAVLSLMAPPVMFRVAPLALRMPPPFTVAGVALSTVSLFRVDVAVLPLTLVLIRVRVPVL